MKNWNWKSTTLDIEKRIHNEIEEYSPKISKYKHKNAFEFHPSRNTLESEFNLFGTVSNKCFSKS